MSAGATRQGCVPINGLADRASSLGLGWLDVPSPDVGPCAGLAARSSVGELASSKTGVGASEELDEVGGTFDGVEWPLPGTGML